MSLVRQSKIEDIKLEQEREAEKFIRLHFKMEQIIYCQDHVYRSTLKKVREEEDKSSRSSLQQNSPNDPVDELLQYLRAYHQVSPHMSRNTWFLRLFLFFFSFFSRGSRTGKLAVESACSIQ